MLLLKPKARDLLSEQIRKILADSNFDATKPIRASHVSPHDFNQFDLKHAGTGEGEAEQGFGIGLTTAQGESPYLANLSGLAAANKAVEKGRIALPHHQAEILRHNLPSNYLDEVNKYERGMYVEDYGDRKQFTPNEFLANNFKAVVSEYPESKQYASKPDLDNILEFLMDEDMGNPQIIEYLTDLHTSPLELLDTGKFPIPSTLDDVISYMNAGEMPNVPLRGAIEASHLSDNGLDLTSWFPKEDLEIILKRPLDSWFK